MPKAEVHGDRPAEATMNKKYAGWSKTRRMLEAIRLVQHESYAQFEAAAYCGVSRTRLNVRLQAAKADAAGVLAPSADAQRAQKMPEVKNEKRRLPDFWEFDRLYFGGLVCPDCNVHHETPDVHKRMIDMIRGPSSRNVILTPPYHAKSTLITVKDTIYDVCENPNSRTLIVSKSGDLGERFLESIKEYMTNPELYENCARNLIEDWGPFYDSGKGWNAKHVYVAGRMTPEKDPTIQVVGVTKQIYGRRADRVKFDDIADTENQANPERVTKMLGWIDKMALSRIGQSGKADWVGTRVGPNDIYKTLIAREGYQVVKFPCIVDEESHEMLWGEHFPYEQALVHRAEMVPADFQLIYQQLDVPGAGASFTAEAIDPCKDLDLHTGTVKPGWKVVGGLDPAGGTGRSGYTAMMVKAIDPKTGKRFYVDVVNVRAMKAPQLRDTMYQLTEAYNITEWRVEANGLQSQIVQYNEEIMHWMTSRGVRVQPHFTGGNKWDPEFGVESTAPLWYNQMVSVPWCCEADRRKWTPFLEQLMQFPMDMQTTDMVMADWFSEIACRDFVRRQSIPLFSSRMQVPDRIKRQRRIVDFSNREVRRVPLRDQREGHLTPTGLASYRRMTVGRPAAHTEVVEFEEELGPKFVNIQGHVSKGPTAGRGRRP